MPSNTYLTQSADLSAGTRAKAEDINTRHTNVYNAFDKLPDTDGAGNFTEVFGIAAGTSASHPAQIAQVRNAALLGVDSGAANAYVVTMTPAPAAYTTGMMIVFKPLASNTGACTVNVNGLGVKSIKSTDGGDPAANELLLNNYALMIYDGTNFQLLTASMAAVTVASETIPAAAAPAYMPIRVNSAGTGYELGQGVQYRNRVINSEMMIDQRNEGAATTAVSTYTADRFLKYWANTDELAISAQRTTGIGNNRNSIKVTATTAETAVAADEYCQPFIYRFLGYDVADLGGATVTLSFDFKSNAPNGSVFSIQLRAGDNSRSYVTDFTYATSAAVQTVTKTITLEAGTTTITNSTTGIGLVLCIACCGGANNAASSTDTWIAGNKFYSGSQRNWITTLNEYVQISGVQLRKGSAYVPLEMKSRAEYLFECLPYYQKSYADGTASGSATSLSAIQWRCENAGAMADAAVTVRWERTMIGTPTVTLYDISGTSGKVTFAAFGGAMSSVNGTAYDPCSKGFLEVDTAQTFTAGDEVLFHYTSNAEI